jgi:hypothetical protein
LVRVFVSGASNDLRSDWAHGGVAVAHVWKRLGNDAAYHGENIAAEKGRLPSQHHVQRGAQPVNIDTVVEHVIAAGLFGCHERRRANGRAIDGDIGFVAGLFGEAEVAYLGEAVAIKEDVRGFDVAMNDVGLVQCLHAQGGVANYLQRLALGERELTVFEQRLNVTAFHQLHGHIQLFARAAEVVHGDHVGVAQGAGSLGFEDKAFGKGIGAFTVGLQHLERHFAAHRFLPGAIDRAHAAGANPRQHLVASYQLRGAEYRLWPALSRVARSWGSGDAAALAAVGWRYAYLNDPCRAAHGSVANGFGGFAARAFDHRFDFAAAERVAILGFRAGHQGAGHVGEAVAGNRAVFAPDAVGPLSGVRIKPATLLIKASKLGVVLNHAAQVHAPPVQLQVFKALRFGLAPRLIGDQPAQGAVLPVEGGFHWGLAEGVNPVQAVNAEYLKAWVVVEEVAQLRWRMPGAARKRGLGCIGNATMTAGAGHIRRARSHR